MGTAAENLIESFEALDSMDQQEVLAELLRRTLDRRYQTPADKELLRVADEIFLDMDRRENKA